MRRFVLPAVLACLVWAAPALAADSMYEGDPAQELKEDIEDQYGIYILNASRRHPKERVEVNGENVELWLFHDPRKVDYDRIKCDAIKWLLTGRFGDKGGAKAFFDRFQKFNAVELDLFQLNSVRTVDKDGKYNVARNPSTILKVRITRKRADKLNWQQVEETLKKLAAPAADPSTCVRTAEKLVDQKFYNKEYFR